MTPAMVQDWIAPDQSGFTKQAACANGRPLNIENEQNVS
jgi:hypothetical protein